MTNKPIFTLIIFCTLAGIGFSQSEIFTDHHPTAFWFRTQTENSYITYPDYIDWKPKITRIDGVAGNIPHAPPHL